VLDVTTLRQLRPTSKGTADLFTPATVTRWQLDFTHEGMFRTGTRHFVGKNPQREATFDYCLPKKAEKLSLKVFDPQGSLVRDLDLAKDKDAGMHRIAWDLVNNPKSKETKGKFRKAFNADGQPVKPGTYRVVLDADGSEVSRLLTIEPDPRSQKAGVAVDEAEELRRLLRDGP
jgi:hypothetical protein